MAQGMRMEKIGSGQPLVLADEHPGHRVVEQVGGVRAGAGGHRYPVRERAAAARAVQRGRIPRGRLDEAIGRILLAKQDYKLIARSAGGPAGRGRG